MIYNFLDKLGGFLDKRFIVAYWAPVFLFGGLLGGIEAAHSGLNGVLQVWEAMSATTRIVAATSVLLAITAVAYVLQALTGTVVRLYEGYLWPGPFARRGIGAEKRRLSALETGQTGHDPDTPRFARYVGFPREDRYVRPTRLGNVLTAAEQYPLHVYGLDGVLWWPRLFPLLPDVVRGQIDASLVPMVCLLNLATACVLAALFGGGYLAWTDHREWLFAGVLLGGLLLARLFYRAAVSQAVGYGNLIRTAFDLCRHALLKQIGLFTPQSVEDEKALWKVLNSWIYDQYLPPSWQAGGKDMPAWVANPFRYDGSPPAPSGAGAPSLPPASQTGSLPPARSATTVRDYMIPIDRVITVRPDLKLGAALTKTKADSVVLVRDDTQIHAVVRASTLASLPDPEHTLAQAREALGGFGITVPGALAAEVLAPIPRVGEVWYVVIEGGAVIGVLAPLGFPGVATSGMLPGPITGVARVCFCCQAESPLHCYNAEEAQAQGLRPGTLCPHDSTIVTVYNPRSSAPSASGGV